MPAESLVSRRERAFTQVYYRDLHIGRVLGATAFLVYTYLDLKAGRNDAAWPSYRTMAADLGISQVTAQKAVNALIEASCLLKEAGGPKVSNRYVVLDVPFAIAGEGVSETDTGVLKTDTPSVSETDTEEDSVKNSQEEVPLTAAEPKKESPFALYEGLCQIKGRPITGEGALPEKAMKKQLAFAKHFIADGYTVEQGIRLATYLQSESFWNEKGFDIQTLRQQVEKWVLNGEPARAENQSRKTQGVSGPGDAARLPNAAPLVNDPYSNQRPPEYAARSNQRLQARARERREREQEEAQLARLASRAGSPAASAD